MDAARHRQVKAIAEQVLDLPPAARGPAIAAACGDDAALAAAVGDWLDAIAAAESAAFLAAPAARPEIELAGQRYRLLRELGRGGMGTVFLAERADGEFEARYALKLLHAEVAGDEQARRRLRAERQILARLAHPNIARLIDGGTLADGRPFLVMDYVDGEPIDAWCERHRLDTEARLRLWLKVCAAVAHAHANLVAHRDLKPANILVDSDGEPRLLDFGIAKLLDDGGATATLDRHMSLAYAAPEQIRGEPTGTAVDVHALGVVLYRLLTGRLPFGADGDSLPALASAICEREPVAPSSLAKLDPDLDFIIARALRKEPAQRYASVEAFAADLERHLDGRPVLARRGTRSYRLRKFVRRRRWPLAAAALLLALVTAFVIDRQQQLDVAERERARAERLVEFLVGLFDNADPAKAGGRTLPVADLLEAASHRARADLAGQPLDRAAMLATIGSAWRALGDFEQAEALLGEALALRRADPSSLLPAADTAFQLALGAQAQGRFDVAEQRFEQARALLVAGAAPAWRLADLDGQRAMLARKRGDLERAQQAIDEAQARLLTAFGLTALPAADDPRLDRERALALATMLTEAGAVAHDRKRWAEAEPLLQRAIELRRHWAGADDPGLATALTVLANGLHERGRLADSIALRQRIVALREANYGPSHWQTGIALVNLGDSLSALARWPEAFAAAERATGILEAQLGPDHPYTLIALGNQATALSGAGDYARALPLAEQVLARRLAVLPPEHEDIALARYQIATTLLKLGRAAEALDAYTQAFASYAALYGADHPYLDENRIDEAQALHALGRDAEAEARLRTVLGHDGRDDANPLLLASARFQLAQLIVERAPDEATALAEAALATAEQQGRSEALDAGAIHAWLAQRSAR